MAIAPLAASEASITSRLASEDCRVSSSRTRRANSSDVVRRIAEASGSLFGLRQHIGCHKNWVSVLVCYQKRFSGTATDRCRRAIDAPFGQGNKEILPRPTIILSTFGTVAVPYAGAIACAPPIAYTSLTPATWAAARIVSFLSIARRRDDSNLGYPGDLGWYGAINSEEGWGADIPAHKYPPFPEGAPICPGRHPCHQLNHKLRLCLSEIQRSARQHCRACCSKEVRCQAPTECVPLKPQWFSDPLSRA